MSCIGRFALPFLTLGTLLSGCSSSPPPPISVSLTPSSSQAIDQGLSVGIQAALTNDASGKGVAWSLSGAGSLSSLTGPSISYITPTTALAGAQQATVTAKSLADPTKSASVAITVNPDPDIPFQTLATGTVGVPYSHAIALAGGTAPFQWSIYNGLIATGLGVGGSVPDGLTLDASTGTVSGTPTAAGTWYFEVTATDADEMFSYNAPSIQINPASAAKANPVPFLNQPLLPASALPGSGEATLRVSGTGFVSGATVDFNGTALTTTFVDSGHLTAVLPATNTATAKTASLTVVNPGPGGGTSNPAYFQVGAPQTSVSFANAPNSPFQVTEPAGLAVADFNEDGKPDLAVSGSVKLYVMLNNGDGTFSPAAGSPVPMPSPPYDDLASPYTGPMAVGDFDHSGHQGLAVEEVANDAALILLGNGNGTFAVSSAAFAQADADRLSAVETADFNADGNLDLALLDQFNYTGLSIVALGYGKGAFNSAGTLYTKAEGFPAGVAIGDFNGDGRLDAAVANGGSAYYPFSGLTVSLGNGDGTFTQASASPMPLGDDLSAIVTGDFNGDGKLDLAATDATGNTVLILLGNGDGTFQPATRIAVGNQPLAMVMGDFNNDGKLDLAMANYGDKTVTLLLGNGGGTFTQAPGSPYPVGTGPSAIAAADFNGDGKLDLAVANSTDATVSILLQQ